LLVALAQRAALAIQNARLHEESERQREELEALYEADEALHQSLRLQDVLNALVDAAMSLLRVDGAGLWGPERAGESAPLASRGLSAQNLAEVLTTQIRVGGEHFGSFTVGRRRSHRFSEQEQRLLTALAQRAGVAIQNARLYEQAQQAATLEERQRLARELHDAVTQTLFSTALIAEVLPDLWDIDANEGRQRLTELRRLTRGALAEMRTLLVELRPGALSELPLGDLLRQLAEATAGRTRLEVAAQVDGPVRRLPPAVHVAMYRMAQEALNNVVKHAKARHASLELSFEPDCARLRVVDDGCGFVQDGAVAAGHFGLGIMRERAAAIGAQFELVSQLGTGTRVEITWWQR
jgi:signal transduction histidine kinase